MSESATLKADMTQNEDRMVEIARMSEILADRILQAQILALPVRESDILALLEASLLLSESGQETPPLVVQVVRKLDATKAAEDDYATDEDEQQGIERIART